MADVKSRRGAKKAPRAERQYLAPLSKGNGCSRAVERARFSVENPPYRIETLVIVSPAAECRRYMRRRCGRGFPQVDFGNAAGLTVPCVERNGSQTILLWMDSFDFSVEDMGTLAHECLHAAVYVLRNSGVRSVILEDNGGDSDDEALAYMVGEMHEKILRELSRRWRRNAPAV